MKPVDQTKFHDKELGLKGNCMQACVASLLELPLDEVPNFVEEEDFWGSVNEFFARFNLRLFEPVTPSFAPHIYHLASGFSPRGVMHAVIYLGDKLAHDPHPSRAGIDPIRYRSIIIPKDVALHVRSMKC